MPPPRTPDGSTFCGTAATIVCAFYAAIDDQDYQTAWNLGGQHLGRHRR